MRVCRNVRRNRSDPRRGTTCNLPPPSQTTTRNHLGLKHLKPRMSPTQLLRTEQFSAKGSQWVRWISTSYLQHADGPQTPPRLRRWTHPLGLFRKSFYRRDGIKFPKVFPGGAAVKNAPARQETGIRSLGWEDPLEEKMATHFNILAWRIPPIEELDGLQTMGSQRVRHNWAHLHMQTYTHAYTNTHTHTHTHAMAGFPTLFFFFLNCGFELCRLLL